MNLTWTDSDNTETGFKIERCTGVGCSDFAQITTVAANVTSYSNTGLTASTGYSYRVRLQHRRQFGLFQHGHGSDTGRAGLTRRANQLGRYS